MRNCRRRAARCRRFPASFPMVEAPPTEFAGHHQPNTISASPATTIAPSTQYRLQLRTHRLRPASCIPAEGLSPIPGQNQGEGRAPVSVYPRGFLPRPLVPESGRPSRPVPAAGLVLPLRDTLPKLLSSANTTVDCGNALRHTKLQFQRATVKLLGRRVSRRDQPAMA